VGYAFVKTLKTPPTLGLFLTSFPEILYNYPGFDVGFDREIPDMVSEFVIHIDKLPAGQGRHDGQGPESTGGM